MKLKIVGKPKLKIGSFVFSVLLVLSYLISNTNHYGLFTAYIAVFALLLSYDETVCLTVFLLPLAPALNSTHIFVLLLLILIVKSGKIPLARMLLIAGFAMLEIAAHYVHGLFSTGDAASTNRMMGYIIAIALLLYLLTIKRNVDFSYCVAMYLNGVSVLFLAFFAMMANRGELVQALTGALGRIGVSGSNQGIQYPIMLNSNSIAYLSIAGIACCLVLFQNGEGLSIKEKMYLMLKGGLSFITGFLTLSRSWIVALIVCFVLFAFSGTKDAKKLAYRLCGMFCFALLVLVVIGMTTNIFDAILERFFTESLTTGGGRTVIMKMYFEKFFGSTTYMLLGTGVTDYTDVLHVRMSAHNATQQILVCLGIPGFVVMMCTLAKPAWAAFKQHVSLLYWIPIVCIALFVQTIQFLNPAFIMMTYAVGVFALRMGCERIALNEKEQNHD